MRTVIIYDYAQGKEVMGRLEMTGRPDFFRTFSLDEQNMGGTVPLLFINEIATEVAILFIHP